MDFSPEYFLLICLLAPFGSFGYDFAVTSITSLRGNLVENIAIRSNGQILATSAAPCPKLWQIDPLRIRDPVLIATFEGTSGTYGITEIQPDEFYVATGNVTFNGVVASAATAFSIWRVNMRSFQAFSNGTIVSAAKLSKVVDMPPHAAINGLTSIFDHSVASTSLLLAADSLNGVIWSVTLPLKGHAQVHVAINDTSMLPPPPSKALGINGIKYFNSTLYHTNSAASTLHAFNFHPKTARASSKSSPRLIANVTGPDDLILDTADPSHVFVCSQRLNSILYIDLITGKTESIVGTVYGPTALAWGRGVSDVSSLYLTTNGGGKNVDKQGVSRIDIGHVAH